MAAELPLVLVNPFICFVRFFDLQNYNNNIKETGCINVGLKLFNKTNKCLFTSNEVAAELSPLLVLITRILQCVCYKLNEIPEFKFLSFTVY